MTKDLVTLSYECLESMELPNVWLIANSCGLIWEWKTATKLGSVMMMKSELLARAKILQETKKKHYMLHNAALLLNDLITQHFH